jgi:hypothetical protein
MSNQTNHSSLYPAGHIRYAFKMHVAHDIAITCKVAHPKVRELVLEKVTPADEFDAEWIMTIHFGSVNSIEEVDEVGNSIKDDIIDMLSFILNTKIAETKLVGHGLTPRPGEGGIAHLLLPSPKFGGTGKVGGFRLSSENIQEVQNAVSRISGLKHKPLISLFRHAISTDEPLVQFMIFYLILYEMYRTQPAVDRYIMNVAPSTPQSISPHTRKPETIYTKLRNEITHRTSGGLEITKAEIVNHLDEFRVIVHRAVKSRI